MIYAYGPIHGALWSTHRWPRATAVLLRPVAAWCQVVAPACVRRCTPGRRRLTGELQVMRELPKQEADLGRRECHLIRTFVSIPTTTRTPPPGAGFARTSAALPRTARSLRHARELRGGLRKGQPRQGALSLERDATASTTATSGPPRRATHRLPAEPAPATDSPPHPRLGYASSHRMHGGSILTRLDRAHGAPAWHERHREQPATVRTPAHPNPVLTQRNSERPDFPSQPSYVAPR
jgi:hypothetical protein